MIINIRGTNGSGKTSLVRSILGDNLQPIDLITFPDPTKRDPTRMGWVEGVRGGENFAIGSYKTACGGLDTIKTFAQQQEAIRVARSGGRFRGWRPRHIFCEGVLCSTVSGSWVEFFKRYPGEVLVAYLDTPLEVCLARITARQEAAGRVRDIKMSLVSEKMAAIAKTREKMNAAGVRTVSLHYETAIEDLNNALDD